MLKKTTVETESIRLITEEGNQPRPRLVETYLLALVGNSAILLFPRGIVCVSVDTA
jgi:hypothetical protein